MKKRKFQEKGQALIIIALAAVVLFGFAALAIDGSRVFSDRRQAQNAADTAVMAAALAKVRGNDYTSAAVTRATSNGYTNGTNNATVTVNLCSQVACIGLPAGATTSEYIVVRITSIVPMTFGRILGKPTIPNSVEAIARAKVPPPGSTGGPFFNGAGMAATKSDSSNQCFLVNGNADLSLHGTGIFVNCTGTEALFTNGGAKILLEANANIAGCAKNQGGNFSGAGQIVCNVPQQTINASTFASVPTTLPTPTCGSAGSQSGNTLSPGYFNGNVSFNSTTTLNPGTYCFNGGLNVNGQANLQGTGAVKIVLGGSLNLAGSANTFDDLEVYSVNSDLRVTGSLTANRLRYFSTGTGSFIMQNGTLTAPNTYLYSYRGTIDINSTSVVNIHAPAQGDTFGGLLIHMPWGNTNAFILNGSTEDNMTGTIMVPSSDVTYNGGSGFTLHGQVIGSTFKVNGGGHTDIYYNAAENYSPPSAANPTIEITK